MTRVSTVHVVPFILTFIVTLILITIYNIIKPEYTTPLYNMSPFPTITPENVPNANINWVQKCKTTLVPPDNGTCAMCGDNFVPTTVGENQNVVYNGIQVPAGVWCLPDGLNEQGCGTYTGKAIWSDTSEGQKWQCVCLYPDLFGGKNCMTQLACIDLSQDVSSQIPENKNYNNSNVLMSKDGHVWDPLADNFNPNGTTPYDKDENGNPIYTCSCNANNDTINTVKYTQLPNDPYRCHADPCTTTHFFKSCDKAKDGEPCGFDSVKGMCNCPRIKAKTYAHSNVDGKCYNMVDINGESNPQCPSWDDEKQVCVCGDENSLSLTCESDYMIRDKYDTKPCDDNSDCPCDGDNNKVCTIKCKNNPGGSLCESPCGSCPDPSNCPCNVVGTEFCTVDQTNKTFICKCKDTNTLKYFGKRCEQSCIKDGVELDGPHNDPSECCSNKIHENCTGNTCRYYCGPSPPDPIGSCFIGNTLITMSNGTRKRIDEVKVGDYVISGKTLLPVKVLIVDIEDLDDRKLIGINSEPFVTEDHCFISFDKKRLVFNRKKSLFSKHWKEVYDLDKNSILLNNNHDLIKVDYISEKYESENIPVYDLITEDHSYIANNYCVYDDFPEIEKYKKESIIILELMKIINTLNLTHIKTKNDCKKISMSLYYTYILEAKNKAQKLNINMFDRYVYDFIELVNKNKNLLYISSDIWRYKLNEL